MGKKLIITEKPSVAQDYARVFNVSGRNNGYIENKDYVITWCVGHLVEMVYPEEYDIKYKKWALADLPFLPETYKYGIIKNVKQQYDTVHALLHRKDIDTVYWAGDSGKEGQTIEENIRNFGGVRKGMTELRVWIDSQTEEEIRRGVQQAKPMSDYARLGASGIMRSIEDYAMGINFSRVMSVKYGRLLNNAAATKSYTAIAVGRVMTCVLGMVVNREREIRNFKETPYYRVVGSFTNASIEAEWKAVEGSEYFGTPKLYKENGFKEKADAQALIDKLNGKPATVKSLEKGISKKKPPLLFNLAELQAECSKRFKISPDEALQAAQDLYEKKLTTYPRTDARVLTTAVAKEIGKNLNGLKNYQPTQGFTANILQKNSHMSIAKTQYTDDSKVTDHYAIIPTGQLTELSSLTPLQSKVFDLIVRRFLSIFYPHAEYQTIKLAIGIENESFFTSAKLLKSLGYLEVMGKTLDDVTEDSDGEDTANKDSADSKSDGKRDAKKLLAAMSALKKGDSIEVKGLDIKESKTTPPKRYTSGSMILAMENAGQLIEDEELRAQIKGSGIGTSATRAEIIKKLIRIGYLDLNKKTQVITPQSFGEMVYEVVAITVPALLNPKMTASWEKGLDGITNGTVDVKEYRTKLEDFIRRETCQIRDKDLTAELTAQINKNVPKSAQSGSVDTSNDLNSQQNAANADKDAPDKAQASSPAASVNGSQSNAAPANITAAYNDTRTRIGAKCPLCGNDIVVTTFGYGCASYDKTKENSCRFAIGKIAGKDISERQAKELLNKGKTAVLKGFKSKTGKKFDAALKLDNGQVVFDFPERPQPSETALECPRCKAQKLKKSQWYYECGCGFRIGHTVAQVNISEELMRELFATGRTSQKITGFKSKAGKTFDAFLRYENETMKFDFNGQESVPQTTQQSSLEDEEYERYLLEQAKNIKM